ncbi:unnamed protein product [Rhizopus stolonifer]
MGNLPSKENENENKIRRPSHGSNESTHLFPTKIHFSPKRRSKETVSPVRHQRVTADPTCLTSLSAVSLKSPRFTPAQLKRSRSSQDSSFSEEIKLPKPVILEENSIEKGEEFDTQVFAYGAEKERDRQTREVQEEEEEEEEKLYLKFFHYILKQVFKGNYHVELNQPQKILDSACGVGLWSMEMGEEFPECEVIGIDILPPSEKYGWSLAKAASAGQTNVSFQFEDICKPTLSFSDNTFDFVFQREVSTIVSASRWPQLISEYYRIITPGGKIQLVEYEMGFRDPGPITNLINEWYVSAASAIQTRIDYAQSIPEYLEAAGFTEIKQQDVYVPIGEWSTDPLQRQYGYLYREQMKSAFRSMKGWWCKQTHLSSEEYDQICEDALNEFEVYQSKAKWSIFTAEKPV